MNSIGCDLLRRADGPRKICGPARLDLDNGDTSPRRHVPLTTPSYIDGGAPYRRSAYELYRSASCLRSPFAVIVIAPDHIQDSIRHIDANVNEVLADADASKTGAFRGVQHSPAHRACETLQISTL